VVLADEPTASLDTERANQVVQIFADLIHEQNKAGIMVTHDLRMMKYVDKVIQMVDGQVAKIITARNEIEILAGTSKFDAIEAPLPVYEPKLPALPIPVPAFPNYAALPVSGD